MLDHDLKPITGPAPKACTRKATLHLRHSEDRTPVMMSKTPLGKPLYLCAGCVAVIQAAAWAKKHGIPPTSQTQVGTLARLISAPAGYSPPPYGSDSVNAGNVWHFLKVWHKAGLVMRRDLTQGKVKHAVYALKDACPDCLCRGKHADGCGLVFGPEFAERLAG